MKYIKALLVGFTIFFILYLVGSFRNANFDINLWSDDSRTLIAYVGFICSGLGIVISVEEFEK